MADGWEDIKNILRVQKVEGGYYESSFIWDEELFLFVIPFDAIAEILEEELGRKPTPEEVEEAARKAAGDPMAALEARPDPPRRGEEGSERFRETGRRFTDTSGCWRGRGK